MCISRVMMKSQKLHNLVSQDSNLPILWREGKGRRETLGTRLKSAKRKVPRINY